MEDFDSVNTITYVDEDQKIVGQTELIIRGEMSYVTAHLNLVNAPKHVLDGFKEAAQQFWLIPTEEREKMPELGQLLGPAKTPQSKAKHLVRTFLDARSNPLGTHVYDVEVISFNEALQNWTCLLISTLDEKTFFHIVYNGDKEEAYFNVFRQAETFAVKDESILW